MPLTRLKTWLIKRALISTIGKETLVKLFGKSWKTSLFGAGGIGSLLFTGVIQPLIDGDPTTNPQWGLVIPGCITALGLLFSKDSNVTGGTVQQ